MRMSVQWFIYLTMEMALFRFLASTIHLMPSEHILRIAILSVCMENIAFSGFFFSKIMFFLFWYKQLQSKAKKIVLNARFALNHFFRFPKHTMGQ